MGLNDLQSQINRLASKTSRQEDIIRDLQTKVATAEQHAATTQQNLNSWAGAGGGGGGNPVVWGKLLETLDTARMAGTAPPFNKAAEGTATLQLTNASSETLEPSAEPVGVFTLGLHNSFKYDDTRVSMVKDDAYTEYKGDKDWYRLIESSVAQDVYCRLKESPVVDSTPSCLGEDGELYVYMNKEHGSFSAGTPTLWAATGTTEVPVIVGETNDEWDVRLRTGHPLNEKDVYRGQFWPDNDLLIVDQVACIMALVGSSAVADSVGCFKWTSLPTDTNYYYPMGKRFSIVGQFKSDVSKGGTAAFRLLKWSGSDFAPETIYGKEAPGFSTTGTWPIEFASGAVVNAAGFTVKGSGTFSLSEDIVACQYDEASGVYLAAPIRCTQD